MDFEFQVGTTSKRIPVFIADSTATDGSGKTGLAFGTTSLICYYWREDEGNVNATAVTLATATRGTWATGGFIEKDATHAPGWYEFSIPDAALASGAGWVIVEFSGAAGIVPRQLQIQLVGYNPAAQAVWAKNTAVANFPFYMENASGVAQTGLTVTATRSIDGAAFAAGSLGAITEIANGWYKLSIDAASLNGTTIAFRFTATGAIDTGFTVVTQS